MKHNLEILAPAGDSEMLRAAVFSGASCVYLGVRGFNARRTAANFEGESLAEAVAFCHARGCGVYAAINTLVLPGREAAVRAAVESAATAGCDGVIVQDFATVQAVREVAPGLPLHASTQMSVHSLAGVEKLAELGFARAILARECTRQDIEHMAARSPIQLEVFVHGALCVSVSGQCYASAFLGGRSANRGGCAGPCRLPMRALCAEVGGDGDVAPCTRPATDTFHLSMKDLSIIDHLPELEAMGIAAAKIEGRLRGPEYCAVVVDSARKALEGEPYDKQLLQDVFSRGGFTGGWYTGAAVGECVGGQAGNDPPHGRKAAYPSGAPVPGTPREASGSPSRCEGSAQSGQSAAAATRPPLARLVVHPEGGALWANFALRSCVGAAREASDSPSHSEGSAQSALFSPRTEADAAASKAAQPRARALYRRERPRVPVEMALRFGPHGGELTVTDGCRTVRRRFGGPLPAAERDPAPALAAALAKTGGTPFYLPEDKPPVVEAGDAFMPGAVAGSLRREALEELLEQRQSMPPPYAVHRVSSSWGLIGHRDEAGLAAQLRAARAAAGRPALLARFEHVAQLPPNAEALCHGLALPLAEAARVPEALRAKTFLWLPRVLFGQSEARAAQQIAEAKSMGFAGFEAGNLAHLKLCEGLPMLGGFGLNVANPRAAAVMLGLGCTVVTLSPELSLAQLREVAAAPQLNGLPTTAALAYGHLPLMLTRACPLPLAAGHSGSCAGCSRAGALMDRTGRALPLACRDGARSLYNPIPLWMADRLAELPCDGAVLYFTTESREQAGEVLAAFAAGRPAAGQFTRGLYDRGTEG